MRIGAVRIGFMLVCPWRLEWGRVFEYWDRYQCGPFYVLHYRDETDEIEASA